jgi:hypothetical protein
MSSLNTPHKHSQCMVEKVCEPLDLITGWPSFVSNNLNQIFSAVVTDQTCTNGQKEFWTIPLYKIVSVLQYSWDVWCEQLSWGHSTASQLGWGQDSDRATPEGVFSSVHAILLLIYFCALGRCRCITQLLLSINWQTDKYNVRLSTFYLTLKALLVKGL